jgi:hypothetical protein
VESVQHVFHHIVLKIQQLFLQPESASVAFVKIDEFKTLVVRILITVSLGLFTLIFTAAPFIYLNKFITP